MELKGTRTEQNLMAAFAGESQARNKYTYFASKAKKEGYNHIAELFLLCFKTLFILNQLLLCFFKTLFQSYLG